MYPDIKNIHIGQIIDARIKECGMTYAQFARRLCVERTTIYNLIRSKSIDTERLMRIGKILDFDFLRNVYLIESDTPPGILRIEVNGKAVLTDATKVNQIKITVTPSPGHTD